MDKTIDKRMRIQEAAAILFREQGVETTSVNDIVKKANVAKGETAEKVVHKKNSFRYFLKNRKLIFCFVIFFRLYDGIS